MQLSPVPARYSMEYPKELTHGFDDVAASTEDTKRWREMQAQGMEQKSPREFCEAQEKVFRFVLIGNPANASRIPSSHCDLENEWPSNVNRTFQSSYESRKKVNITQEQMKKISMPVLIIHGTKDRNAPYGGGREWAASLPNARLVTIEGMGHDLPRALWPRFVDLIVENAERAGVGTTAAGDSATTS